MNTHAQLNDTTLDRLDDRVDTPDYDRSALRPAVVHLSVGGFARAHQAAYFDDLARLGDTGWGIVGVGMRSPEMGMVLRDQEGLFTLVEQNASGGTARVVGSIVDYIYQPEEPERVLDVLAAPTTQLVTLTVTGEGYRIPDERDADIVADRAGAPAPSSPAGLIVTALRARRAAGTGPFTVLSCDNMDDSGAAARAAVLGYARLVDPELAAWIEHTVSFPSSMVDRITPGTSPELRDEIEELYGVPDRWPVVTEPFRQWVIEDDFSGERPPLDRVGAQFVADVKPFKRAKSRLLNGAHVSLGYLGVLAGLTTTAEAMADDQLGEAIRRMLRDEVHPILEPVPGFDLGEYADTTIERLENPEMEDALVRLCRRGSTKVPFHLLPSLVEAIERDTPRRVLALAVAGWLRYLDGTGESGETLVIEDVAGDTLTPIARAAGADPRPLLERREIFGDAVHNPRLVAELEPALAALHRDGVRAALADALSSPENDTPRKEAIAA